MYTLQTLERLPVKMAHLPGAGDYVVLTDFEIAG
jgi:hypothetical protein